MSRAATSPRALASAPLRPRPKKPWLPDDAIFPFHVVDALRAKWIHANVILPGRSDGVGSASFVVYTGQDGYGNITGCPAYYRGPVRTAGHLLSAVRRIEFGAWRTAADALYVALGKAGWWRVSHDLAHWNCEAGWDDVVRKLEADPEGGVVGIRFTAGADRMGGTDGQVQP